jgi:hypothetical protein
MAIHLYKKGRKHIVPSVNDPELELDCTIVSVESNEERLALLAQGDQFDTVDELHAPPKPKKARAKAGEKTAEVVESEDETDVGAPEDEDENTAD